MPLINVGEFMRSLNNNAIYVCCGILLCVPTALAQASAQVSGTAAHVRQVPRSGRQGANIVSAQQSARHAGESSANAISTSIQVEGAYQGRMPGSNAGHAPSLTLGDAIERGLRYNLGTAAGSYVKVVQCLPVRIGFKLNRCDLDRRRTGMSAEPMVHLDANCLDREGSSMFLDELYKSAFSN